MIRTLLTVLRIVVRVVLWPVHRLTRRRCDALRFTLKGSPPPLPRRRGLLSASFGRRPPPLSLRTLQRRLARATADAGLPCVLVDISRLEAGWATLLTMHQLLSQARRGGKRVVAYLPEGGGLAEYFVATAADEIWLGPSAALSLTGLAVEATYLAPAFERLGLRAQVEAVGRYKTAGEPYLRHEMSPENAEMLGAILDEIDSAVIGGIEETRELDASSARRLAGEGPYGPSRAVELGLADDVCYPDQLASRLASRLGLTGSAGAKTASILRWPAYARGRHIEEAWPLGRHRIPVLEIDGMLVEGRSRGVKGMVGAEGVVKLLRRLRKDPAVAAVVLHINSRGGTVVASDQIRREVERLAEKKPVVASLSDVAASGGYMIAAAAHQIVAQPLALTGSIGVLAGKLSGRRLLEGLGLHRQAIRRGAHASFGSPAAGWSAAERGAVRAMVEEHYRHFVDVVARGRRLPPEQVLASAEGRVWTGRAALERGLVDALGGLGEAIAAARETSPEARRALIEPLRPPAPMFPELLLPKSVSAAVALALAADSRAAWALEPFELRIR
jgi:protease-4